MGKGKIKSQITVTYTVYYSLSGVTLYILNFRRKIFEICQRFMGQNNPKKNPKLRVIKKIN